MADTDLDLHSQYLAQVQADLARNTEECDRIAAEVTALQERMKVLQQNDALLVALQQTLLSTATDRERGTTAASTEAEEASTAASQTRKPATTSRTRTSSASTRITVKSAANGRHSSAAATPTLVQLVTADLSGHSDPRSALEVGIALVEAYPTRKFQTSVVRNTLEALVAKGLALRSKQGRSVYYSGPDTHPATQ